MNTKQNNKVTVLTKADLVQSVSDKIKLHKLDTRTAVDEFIRIVCQNLVDGENIKLYNFGNFVLRTKPPRPGRNLHTNIPVTISARTVVTFKTSQLLKDRVKKLAKKAEPSKSASSKATKPKIAGTQATTSPKKPASKPAASTSEIPKLTSKIATPKKAKKTG